MRPYLPYQPYRTYAAGSGAAAATDAFGYPFHFGNLDLDQSALWLVDGPFTSTQPLTQQQVQQAMVDSATLFGAI
jgi:hypothetical protein